MKSSPSDRHSTLEARRAARLAERAALRAMSGSPRHGDQDPRDAALVYFARLDTRSLVACHRAAMQMFPRP